MKSFVEFLKDIEKLKNKIIEANPNEVNGMTTIEESKTALADSSKAFVLKILENAKIQDYYKIMKALIPQNQRFDLNSPLFIKIKQEFNLNRNTKKVYEGFERTCNNASKNHLYISDYLNLFDNKMISDNQFNDKFKERLDKVIPNFIYELITKNPKKETLEYFINGINTINEKINTKVDLEKCVPEESIYVIPSTIDTDIHPYNDKINEIIDTTILNKEKEQILNEANDIIVEASNETLLNKQAKLAENIGSNIDNLRVDETYNKLLKENGDISSLFKTTRRNVQQVNVESSLEENTLIASKMENPTLDEAFKNEIKAISKEMDDAGIFIPGNFASEQASKIYSLNSLIKKQNEIKKAVDLKDINLIKEKVNEYKILDEDYTNVINHINSLGNDRFVSNISSSREKNVPQKYRNEFAGVSKLTGLWLSKGFCSSNGIDFNDFVDDPLKHIKAYYGKLITNESRVGKVFDEIKDDPLAIINAFENVNEGDKLFDAMHADIASVNQISRVLDGITILHPSKDVHTNFTKELTFLLSSSAKTINKIMQDSFDHKMDKETLKNLFVCDRTNFNPYEICSNYNEVIDPLTNKVKAPFNRKNAIENGNARNIISTMLKVKEGYTGQNTKNIDDAIVEVANEIKLSPVNKEVDETKMLDYMSKGKQVPKVIESNFKANKLLIDNNNVNKNNVETLLNELAKNKKEYSERSFFAKWFFSGVKRQNALNNQFNTKLLGSGLTQKEIDDSIKIINKEPGFNSINYNVMETIKDKFSEPKIVNNSNNVNNKQQELINRLEMEFGEKVVVTNKVELKLDNNLVKEGPTNEEKQNNNEVITNDDEIIK